MAGEEVWFMEKPNPRLLLIWEALLGAVAFIVLFILVSMFSDLPMHLKAAIGAVFAVLGAGILHFTLGNCTYVVTDQRVLIVDFNSELKDSCDANDVTGLRKIALANTLIVERSSGAPMRLFALKNRDEAERAIRGDG